MSSEFSPLLPHFRHSRIPKKGREKGFGLSRRNLVLILSCVGLVSVGLVSTGVLAPSQNEPNSLHVRTAREVKKEKYTLEYVRQLAIERGSIGPSLNLKADEVCLTQGCLDASIHLLNSINFSVNPCDDYFDFACGKWIENNPIPASSSRWSQFNVLREEVNKITQGILTSEQNADDPLPINQVKDFYNDCINTDALEEAGLGPVRTILKANGDWPILVGDSWASDSFNWLNSIATLKRVFMSSAIIAVSVDQDIMSSNDNIIYIDQPSLVLPRDILINENGAYDAILAAYKKFIVDIAMEFARVGGESPPVSEVETEAGKIIEFETELAKITAKDEDRSDTARMYNSFNISSYQDITDSFDQPANLESINWLNFLNGVFSTSGVRLSTEDRIIVSETAYFGNLTKVLNSFDRRVVSNYILMRYAKGLIGETTNKAREIAFEFNKVLTGAKEPPTREKTCADSANNGLGMAIGVKYIEQTFDFDAKKEVDDMVEDLRVSFKELLESAEWMDPVTKAKAQIKADKMKSFMAFPEWLLGNKSAIEYYYKGLEIVKGDHLTTLLKLSEWAGNDALSKLREPVDRNYWLTYPGVVNAFYAPTYNSITFPAGILQVPFFGKGTPSFLNYGGIGVVIGHEITHGFDNQGRQYDQSGNALPWWTNETLDAYTEKASCIQDQYGAYKPPELDMFVNGLLTLGENIADNGGLRESYLAYQKFIVENGPEGRLPGLEQFSPEQLFFMGYANIWCEGITVAGLQNQILTDPHSPARFRVRGPLVNNDIFAEKWECPVGSTMNPDPSKRCVLW